VISDSLEQKAQKRKERAQRKSIPVFQQKPSKPSSKTIFFWHRKEYSVYLINIFKYSNFEEL